MSMSPRSAAVTVGVGSVSLCDFVSVQFVVTYSSTGSRKRFTEMIAAHGGGHGKGFPDLSYPELF